MVKVNVFLLVLAALACVVDLRSLVSAQEDGFEEGEGYGEE
eukprot:CAMPEP_0173175390 /NCGR_PEP_ID=MMETSP1141-20130122/3889_1 /TAXON_ID=483371 /ORGANISM="non described non described, Strain CCMP2298" /LENGTH=40 /DNA_ID= /DNA_START= /DNA_END= /DNA_ORIENTATION=